MSAYRRHFRRVAAAFVVIASACAPIHRSTAPTTAPVTASGPDVARQLQQRYDDGRRDCGRSSPAFACSGVLIRSTQYSDSYFSWRPNPATAGWGVNMSWLRKDANFADSFPTKNGFVVYPTDEAARRGLVVFQVRCVYPRDAWSTSPDRCEWHQKQQGPRVHTPLCDRRVPPVLTAQEWVAAGYGNDENQCAFAVGTDRRDRAEAWWQMVAVRRLQQVDHRDELVVDSWVGVDDRRMPISAFFYRPESDPAKPDPRAAARNDQRDFVKLTGRWVPIVRWDPTESPEGGARFSYSDGDQLIAAPARP